MANEPQDASLKVFPEPKLDMIKSQVFNFHLCDRSASPLVSGASLL